MNEFLPPTAPGQRANTSPIGRLLEEISWEGRLVGRYRRGGAGLENVLTTEVMLPLAFLPREHFLGAVLRQAHGHPAVSANLQRIAATVEGAEVQVLPQELTLQPAKITVQPDATISNNDAYVLLEAKRAGLASFQPEQLAREYLAVVREAGDRLPLLLLVLGDRPPVLIKGQGPRDLITAITEQLPGLLSRTGVHEESLELLTAQITEVVAWTTWQDIRQVAADQHESFEVADSAVRATVRRLVEALHNAVDVHCP